MFFKTASRVNPQTHRLSIYYRLVENYRNPLGETRQRNIMPVGFMDDITPEELHQIAEGIQERIKGEQVLLKEYSPLVAHYIDNLYTRLVSEKRIDRKEKCHPEKCEGDWQQIDLNSVNNENVREVGAEWMCLQTMDKLGIGSYLEQHGWSKEERHLALAHITCRAVYPASELKTVRFMQDNSSVCELLGLDPKQITKDKLYRISHKLYKEKEGLESHLGHKTNELFDLQDKIILYDLTNTYFEGEMRNSEKAKRGRSKEKRSDCPLLVLALVVNVEGFIKYSAIYEGNQSDPATLGDMIDKLRLATSDLSHKAIVVMDAGIATEENLQLLTRKGYDYVCVSRSNLKKYKIVEGAVVEKVKDRKEREIELLDVRREDSPDSEYYLKVSSPSKALKEKSMSEQFHKRFEEGLERIANGISQKHGTKKYDKVNQRIGRLKEKYPSIHRMYDITLEKTEKDIATSLCWARLPQAVVDEKDNWGVYFLRTSIVEENEQIIWTIYNCIREVESAFRCLKTDLDLRPIYHKTDEASEAHLHLGMLAYWIVNTIRYQLKEESINSQWIELVRIMNTQKCVTTTMINDRQEHISIRCCSKPSQKVALIYETLRMKKAPFIRKKSVVLRV